MNFTLQNIARRPFCESCIWIEYSFSKGPPFSKEFPTKQLCIQYLIAPICDCDVEKASFFQLFGRNSYYLWRKFSLIIRKVDAGTAPSNGANWDEFSETHQHQSPIGTFRVQIKYRIYADFSWAKLPARYSVTYDIWNSWWNYTCKVLYI